jgi:hypothetical protein
VSAKKSIKIKKNEGVVAQIYTQITATRKITVPIQKNG